MVPDVLSLLSTDRYHQTESNKYHSLRDDERTGAKAPVLFSSFFAPYAALSAVTYATGMPPVCHRYAPGMPPVCPGLRMASPTQTCSPLRLSSLPTAIGRPGYSADDSFIPRTPDLSRAKISASFLLWFAYGEATTPALCYACRRPPPEHHEKATGVPERQTFGGRSEGTPVAADW